MVGSRAGVNVPRNNLNVSVQRTDVEYIHIFLYTHCVQINMFNLFNFHGQSTMKDAVLSLVDIVRQFRMRKNRDWPRDIIA